MPLIRRQSSVMWQCCRKETKESFRFAVRRNRSTHPIGNDLDLRPSLGRVTTLSIPKLVDGSVTAGADALALSEDGLLEEARVGLGSAVALVAIACGMKESQS